MNITYCIHHKHPRKDRSQGLLVEGLLIINFSFFFYKAQCLGGKQQMAIKSPAFHSILNPTQVYRVRLNKRRLVFEIFVI